MLIINIYKPKKFFTDDERKPIASVVLTWYNYITGIDKHLKDINEIFLKDQKIFRKTWQSNQHHKFLEHLIYKLILCRVAWFPWCGERYEKDYFSSIFDEDDYRHYMKLFLYAHGFYLIPGLLTKSTLFNKDAGFIGVTPEAVDDILEYISADDSKNVSIMSIHTTEDGLCQTNLSYGLEIKYWTEEEGEEPSFLESYIKDDLVFWVDEIYEFLIHPIESHIISRFLEIWKKAKEKHCEIIASKKERVAIVIEK